MGGLAFVALLGVGAVYMMRKKGGAAAPAGDGKSDGASVKITKEDVDKMGTNRMESHERI